jgi:hypothetical protein
MKIFISGHYTKGDVAQNVAKAIYYANEILKKGITHIARISPISGI